MLYELAPMEGLTKHTVRNAFFHHFTGIDRYYTPFIPVADRMNKKIRQDLLPENNAGLLLVPQLIGNRAEEILFMEQQLREYGYETYNINMGCPSGTVVSKNRGAGFLRDPEAMDSFFDTLFSKTKSKISVKTRIGLESEAEWEGILRVYEKYEFEELVIHPRLRNDFYREAVRPDQYELAEGRITKSPLCYNGDLFLPEDIDRIKNRFPGTDRMMLGRGMFARPGLAECGKTGHWPENYRQKLKEFHEEIYSGYRDLFSDEKIAIGHMKEIWFYLGSSFDREEAKKPLKTIKKTTRPEDYRLAVKELFESCPLEIED